MWIIVLSHVPWADKYLKNLQHQRNLGAHWESNFTEKNRWLQGFESNI